MEGSPKQENASREARDRQQLEQEQLNAVSAREQEWWKKVLQSVSYSKEEAEAMMDEALKDAKEYERLAIETGGQGNDKRRIWALQMEERARVKLNVLREKFEK
ncbi:MAG: hypothetical protein HYT37_01585 [Candidatus Sungbacteria bacterium]|nr:hypothetical protein [Candidatus Sungbacteria bacterium]